MILVLRLVLKTYECSSIHICICMYNTTMYVQYNYVCTVHVQLGESHRLIGTIYLSQGRMAEANKHLKRVSYVCTYTVLYVCTYVHNSVHSTFPSNSVYFVHCIVLHHTYVCTYVHIHYVYLRTYVRMYAVCSI